MSTIEEQREQWNAAAPMWRKWSARIDAAAAHISERLVELAEIGPDDRVLDVGAGQGEPALAAARCAGAKGKVVATDLSGEMLAYARERAAEAGLDNIEFVESDAASLSFPLGTFDAALSRWGIIFEADPEAAAGRIRTFLKPGARMAISSWGPLERVPMCALPSRVFTEHVDVPAPAEGTPGPFARTTREALASLLESGGFADVEAEEAEVTFEWESPEQFTTYVKEMSPRTGRLIAERPQDEQNALWAAVTDAMRAVADKSGRVRLSNQALLAVGRVPA